MTIEIHLTTPADAREHALNGYAISEWDVRIVSTNQLLGVVEECDDGFMYTDTFGHMECYFDGELLTDVLMAVDFDLNKALMH